MPALGDDLDLLQEHPHRVKEYLAILHPATVLACQLYGAPSGDPVTEIAYDEVTEGDHTKVVPGMTLWVGTSPGGRQKGTCRVRKTATTNTLYIAEDSKIDWEDDDHLTVVENFEFWVKYPRVVVNGDITFYKDWNVEYSDQHSNWAPMAVLGPPDCQLIVGGVATCKFVGDRSYPVAPGASITGYAWTFPGGTPPSSASPGTEASPVEVTWDTPGIYWISLVVTDSNGKAHTGRRPVFIFPYTGEGAPYTRFKMTGRSGDINQYGHTASFEVHGDADQAEFPDGALVVYFTEDWYGDTKKSIGGNFPYRAHIKFVGYIQRESTTKDPQTSVVTFDAATINALMETREGFSCWIKDGGSASNWTQATNLTADRAALSLCRYHSTLLDICDVTVSGSTLKIKSQEFAAKTAFLQQLQDLYDDLFAHVACDKQGRLYFEIDPQMRPVAERGTIPVVADLTHGDWRERLDLPRPQEPKTSFINLAGVYYPGHPHEVMPILSKAPGNAPGYGGTTREISGLILAGQADGNEKAGLALAYDNNEFPTVTIPMTGLWDVFDIMPQEYIRLSLAAGDTKRGIVWTNQKLIPRRVELSIEETEAGRVAQVDIHVEKDSFGPAGVDGDYPDDVPDPEWPLTPPPPPPPPPPGPVSGDGNLLYLVDANTGRLFRSRNIRDLPANVVYEDLGVIDPCVWFIRLDPWDPKNGAIAWGTDGAWKTTDLDSDFPTWTQVITIGGTGYGLRSLYASICQQGLWIAGINRLQVPYPAELWISRTTDGWLTDDDFMLQADDAQFAMVQCSSHNPNIAWVTYRNGNWFAVRKTTNLLAETPTWNLQNIGTAHTDENAALCYHRYLENSDDLHGLYGAGIDGVARTFCYTTEFTAMVGSYLDAGAEGQTCLQVGGYTWGANKYIALTYTLAAGYRFHVADDPANFVLQHTFAGVTKYISGWPYAGERFYACQNGAVAPILISDDRGETWQEQTGNWAELGYSGDIRCCVPVWIA